MERESGLKSLENEIQVREGKNILGNLTSVIFYNISYFNKLIWIDYTSTSTYSGI